MSLDVLDYPVQGTDIDANNASETAYESRLFAPGDAGCTCTSNNASETAYESRHVWNRSAHEAAKIANNASETAYESRLDATVESYSRYGLEQCQRDGL